eukprot:3183839-Pyramimonas_sp.AAC.1
MLPATSAAVFGSRPRSTATSQGKPWSASCSRAMSGRLERRSPPTSCVASTSRLGRPPTIL